MSKVIYHAKIQDVKNGSTLDMTREATVNANLLRWVSWLARMWCFS
jgi:hypothetical protein